MKRDKLQGHAVVSGQASGKVLVSDDPLSFWGGYDQQTGEIIDRRHPLSGESAADCVLALPYSRGSSTGTAVLLEAIRNGAAPAAILTTGVDTFFALASIVAKEMYHSPIPIIALSESDYHRLETGTHAEISPDGSIILSRPHTP